MEQCVVSYGPNHNHLSSAPEPSDKLIEQVSKINAEKCAASVNCFDLEARAFDFGASAYLISRDGMEAVLDKYFTDRTVEGQFLPIRKSGMFVTLEAYLSSIPDTLVVSPSMFTVEVKGTSMMKDPHNAAKRLGEHAESNHIHTSLYFL